MQTEQAEQVKDIGRACELIEALTDRLGRQPNRPSMLENPNFLTAWCKTVEKLLGFTDDESGLIRSIMESCQENDLPGMYDFLGVFADYLEETGSQHAARFRKVALNDGDVFVFYYASPAESKAAKRVVTNLQTHAMQTGRTITALAFRRPMQNETQRPVTGEKVTESALRQAGWVRRNDVDTPQHADFFAQRMKPLLGFLQTAELTNAEHEAYNLLVDAVKRSTATTPAVEDLSRPPGETTEIDLASGNDR